MISTSAIFFFCFYIARIFFIKDRIKFITKKFIPSPPKIFEKRNINWVEYSDWNGDFNTPIEMNKIPYVGSVSELAITVALYMGFSEIFLLGFDHDWFNGPLVYLKEGNYINIGEKEDDSNRLEIRFTPGHSPGSISFYHKAGGYLIGGDVLFYGRV